MGCLERVGEPGWCSVTRLEVVDRDVEGPRRLSDEPRDEVGDALGGLLAVCKERLLERAGHEPIMCGHSSRMHASTLATASSGSSVTMTRSMSVARIMPSSTSRFPQSRNGCQ